MLIMPLLRTTVMKEFWTIRVLARTAIEFIAVMVAPFRVIRSAARSISLACTWAEAVAVGKISSVAAKALASLVATGRDPCTIISPAKMPLSLMAIIWILASAFTAAPTSSLILKSRTELPLTSTRPANVCLPSAAVVIFSRRVPSKLRITTFRNSREFPVRITARFCGPVVPAPVEIAASRRTWSSATAPPNFTLPLASTVRPLEPSVPGEAPTLRTRVATISTSATELIWSP